MDDVDKQFFLSDITQRSFRNEWASLLKQKQSNKGLQLSELTNCLIKNESLWWCRDGILNYNSETLFGMISIAINTD